jgi:hypothetical protein
MVDVVNGSSFGGVGSSILAEESAASLLDEEVLTALPCPSRHAEQLGFVLAVVDNCPHRYGHNCQWRYVLRGILIRFGKGIDVLRVMYGKLDLAPGGLPISKVYGLGLSALTDFELCEAFSISSQHGPMIFRLIAKSSNGEVLAPKTWLKVGPDADVGSSGS